MWIKFETREEFEKSVWEYGRSHVRNNVDWKIIQHNMDIIFDYADLIARWQEEDAKTKGV